MARAIVGAEMALTVVLLVFGGLFARSLIGLSRVDPGFDGSSVATVRAHLPITELRDPENIRTRFTRILQRVREIPGVVEVGAIEGLPFPGKATTTGIEIEGTSAGQSIRISTENHLLLPGYLETMGIPLLAGRTLRDDDDRSEGPRSILINEQMARQYWPDESPLGARIRQSRRVYEVVGVVGNIRERHLADPPIPTIYRTGPFFAQSLSLVARTRNHQEDLIPVLRGVIRELYPEVALTQETTMEALLQHSTTIERYRAMIVLFFGGFALFVASVGVFGVTAHSVAQRRQEMGIRTAVGAPARALVEQVVKEAIKSGVVGVGLGCIFGLGASRLVVPFLFGVQSWDQATFLGASLLLLTVCGGTAFLSSLSLFSVDPMIVLREE